jgi:hypothetical protein
MLTAMTTVLMAVVRQAYKNPRLAPGETTQLAPAEVAYLGSKNVTFALAVLVFDLLHYELKNGNMPANLQITGHNRHYEAKLESIFRESLKDWTKKKFQDVVIVDPKANPIGFIRRLPVLYRFLSKGLKDSIGEILQDPRNLRKYFSVQGLMTILAEISASGYKQKFEAELVANLLAGKFLMTAKERQQACRFFAWSFLLCEVLFLALILLAVPSMSHWHALILFATAIIAAWAVKAAIQARSFIPLYEELHNVLKYVPRRNFRVKVLELFLGAVNLLLNGLSVALFCVLFSIGAVVLYFSQIATTTDTYLMLLTMFLAQFSIADWLFEAWRLQSEQPSPRAAATIEIMRKHFARDHITALDALKNMLVSSEYDENVAYLLAVYGLESLFFL